MQTLNILEARVLARNRANAEANRLGPLLRAHFAPYVGKKVLVTGGLLSRKLANLPKAAAGVQCFRHSSEHTLRMAVRVCAGFSEGVCVYETAMVEVGDLNGQTLSALARNCEQRRTDHTVQQVLALRAALSAAKMAVREAASALHPFGEFDHS